MREIILKHNVIYLKKIFLFIYFQQDGQLLTSAPDLSSEISRMPKPAKPFIIWLFYPIQFVSTMGAKLSEIVLVLSQPGFYVF